MADASLQRQTTASFDSIGRLQFKIVALCFLAILFDGIDTTANGVVVPTLARSWAIPPAAFTTAFLATIWARSWVTCAAGRLPTGSGGGR